MKFRDLAKITILPVIGASLCCLSPLIFVMLGLSSVSVAASLANTLYGTYKWGFRALGLILLCATIGLYLRQKNICTLDQARRRKNEVINTFLIALSTGIAGYMFFLYVIVHYVGIAYGIWK